MSPCPAPEVLRAMLTEAADGPTTEALEAHVEHCLACQQTLEAFSANPASSTPREVLPQLRPTPTNSEGREFLRGLAEGRPTGSWPVPVKSPSPGPAIQPPPDGDRSRPLIGPLVAAPGSRRVGDIESLLRKRLLFISVVCWVTFAVYAAFFVPIFFEFLTISVFALMLALSAGLSAILWSARPLSSRQLRWAEGILFAAAVLFFTRFQILFLSWQWREGMLPQTGEDGPVFVADDLLALLLITRGLSFSWCVLILVYGLLIPNTWRRCAAVVAGMALWPMLLNAGVGLEGRPVESHLTFLVESGLNLAIAAALAVYGSHRIEVLREQAVEARKLGQYRLKHRLGGGGMGEVYLAEHVLLRRPCAIKFIRPDLANDPQFLRRFEREVQATATLSHPNTVEVYDYGLADDGTFYYAMEYLPGLSLEELVHRHGSLEPERVVHLLRQVCGALGEAHGVGLVHRDIKPGNVLICQRGGLHDVAKLLDFGLVRTPHRGRDGLTQVGLIAGTPDYMSPEQARGSADVDARSDIYSLGALAYFLLTGHPPFERETAVQTLAAHLADEVASPATLRADLPADLEGIVLRCLAKTPSLRYQSAGEVESALTECACACQWTPQRAAGWWREHPAEEGSGVAVGEATAVYARQKT